MPYAEIAKQYVSYGRGKYGESRIVSDRYKQGPLVKDLRRVKKVCADIKLSESMEAYKIRKYLLQMKATSIN